MKNELYNLPREMGTPIVGLLSDITKGAHFVLLSIMA